MKQVKEVMNPSPMSCSKNESVKMLANRMFKSNIGFLPVLDENKRVVGTVTDRDIALAIGRSSQPIEKLTAQDIMNVGVFSILPDDYVDNALEIMRTKEVGRLPVIDKDNRLRGVISLMGIARKMRESPERSEVEYKGKENIMNTLHAIADRNHNPQSVEEYIEE